MIDEEKALDAMARVQVFWVERTNPNIARPSWSVMCKRPGAATPVHAFAYADRREDAESYARQIAKDVGGRYLETPPGNP